MAGGLGSVAAREEEEAHVLIRSIGPSMRIGDVGIAAIQDQGGAGYAEA